jgi:S1-C subfamily serine protease
LVARVQANGPAARGGLRPGDVIVAVNGERIADSGGLMNKAAELGPGSTARLGIVRAGQESTLAIEVGQRPPSRRKE